MYQVIFFIITKINYSFFLTVVESPIKAVQGGYGKIDGYKGCLLNGNNNNYKIRFSLELYS